MYFDIIVYEVLYKSVLNDEYIYCVNVFFVVYEI